MAEKPPTDEENVSGSRDPSEGETVAYEPKSDDANAKTPVYMNDLEQCVPLQAVRRVVKLENATATSEAQFVLARGTELFLDEFVSDSIREAASKSKASSLVCYGDVANVVKAKHPFLAEMIPVVSASSKSSKSKAKKRKRS